MRALEACLIILCFGFSSLLLSVAVRHVSERSERPAVCAGFTADECIAKLQGEME